MVWLQNRIKELEEALEQERAAHFRVSSQLCHCIVEQIRSFTWIYIILGVVYFSLRGVQATSICWFVLSQ